MVWKFHKNVDGSALKKRTRKMTSKKVKRIAQKVLDDNSEFQRRLDLISGTAITNVSAGHLLYDGPQIVSDGGGEGRKALQVKLRHLKFKLSFKYEGMPVNIRLIGVRYPQGTGSPSLADVLSHSTSYAMISPWRKDGPTKYSIFYNKVIKLGGDAAMTSTYKEKQVDIKAKLSKRGMTLTFESGTTQAPDKNRYCLFAVPNIMPALSADRPVVEGFVSAGFTDI